MSNSALVECTSLSVGFSNANPILKDINLRIHSGEMVALTGRSGSGKSTLLYTLSLMLKPMMGEVFVHGEVKGTASDRVRAACRATKFGFVFQDSVLDPSRSVLDNVLETSLYRMEPKYQRKQEALELLERFEVNVPPDRKPGQVSGGQAQRIAICRALLGEPSIIIADEPTGSLDRTTGDVVIDAFRSELNRGACVLIATHDPYVVDACDRVIRLTP